MAARDLFGDWDHYEREGRAREAATVSASDRRVVRSRVIRGSIWFALAIMPARERWLGWLLDRPHAIVQDHDGPVLEPSEILASLASRP